MVMLDRPRSGLLGGGDAERQMLVHHPFSAQRLSREGGGVPAAKKLASGKINCRDLYQSVIMAILIIIFLILVVCELVATNNEKVRDACGESLWNFMLSRLILTFCEFGLVVMMGLIHESAAGDPGNMQIWLFRVGGLMQIVLHAVLIAVGFVISTKAMGDIACNHALSAASFTKDPLLGVLGFVYVGLDSILLLIMTCGVGALFLGRVFQS